MHRTAVAFVLAASILTSPSLFDPLWNLLSSLWSHSTTESGCRIDPLGHCLPGTEPAADTGCGWDPYGRCLPDTQPASDSGCGMDPWGCPQGS